MRRRIIRRLVTRLCYSRDGWRQQLSSLLRQGLEGGRDCVGRETRGGSSLSSARLFVKAWKGGRDCIGSEMGGGNSPARFFIEAWEGGRDGVGIEMDGTPSRVTPRLSSAWASQRRRRHVGCPARVMSRGERGGRERKGGVGGLRCLCGSRV